MILSDEQVPVMTKSEPADFIKQLISVNTTFGVLSSARYCLIVSDKNPKLYEWFNEDLPITDSGANTQHTTLDIAMKKGPARIFFFFSSLEFYCFFFSYQTKLKLEEKSVNTKSWSSSSLSQILLQIYSSELQEITKRLR